MADVKKDIDKRYNRFKPELVPDDKREPIQVPINAPKKIRVREVMHQENVGAWSKVVLNAPGPPRGVVVPVVHLVHSDPF